MKKISVFVLIVLVFSVSLNAQKFTQQKQHKESRWYFYLLASGIHHIPPEDYLYDAGYESATRFGPTLGLGYKIINPSAGFGMNVELDYSFASFNNDYIKDKSLNIFTLSGYFDLRFSRQSKWTGYCSVGIAVQAVSAYSFLDYNKDFANLPSETIVPMSLALGLKYDINRHIKLRAEFRAYREIYGYDEDEGYYDYYLDDYIDDSSLEGYWRGTTLSIGLEYHFR